MMRRRSSQVRRARLLVESLENRCVLSLLGLFSPPAAPLSDGASLGLFSAAAAEPSLALPPRDKTTSFSLLGLLGEQTSLLPHGVSMTKPSSEEAARPSVKIANILDVAVHVPLLEPADVGIPTASAPAVEVSSRVTVPDVLDLSIATSGDTGLTVGVTTPDPGPVTVSVGSGSATSPIRAPGSGGDVTPPVQIGSGGGVTPPPVETGSEVGIATPPVDTGSEGGVTTPPVHIGSEGGVTTPPVHIGSEGGATTPPVHIGSGGGVTTPPVDTGSNGGVTMPPVHIGSGGGVTTPPVHTGSSGGAHVGENGGITSPVRTGSTGGNTEHTGSEGATSPTSTPPGATTAQSPAATGSASADSTEKVVEPSGGQEQATLTSSETASPQAESPEVQDGVGTQGNDRVNVLLGQSVANRPLTAAAPVVVAVTTTAPLLNVVPQPAGVTIDVRNALPLAGADSSRLTLPSGLTLAAVPGAIPIQEALTVAPGALEGQNSVTAPTGSDTGVPLSPALPETLPESEACDLATGATPFRAAQLGAAFDQFFGQVAGGLEGSLRGWVMEYGAWPWVCAGLIAAAVSSELSRRVHKARAELSVAAGPDDGAVGWYPGMFGPDE
jgi:hypothetical protein